jgi:hypothetical protein
MSIVALGGIIVACNSGPAIGTWPPDASVGGSGGSTGTGGTGGTGGLAAGACTTNENLAVYEGLSYTNQDGDPSTSYEAASAIAADCLYATECSDQLTAVFACFPNCDDATINAFGDCVQKCTQDVTAELSAPGLSNECAACYGATVACGARSCTTKCATDPNADECIQCRCENNCIQEFDSCSGLPPGGECN